MKYLFYLSILINFQYIAQTEKTKIADTLPGWFRFEKNVHALSILPTYTFVRNAFSSEELIKGHIPGMDLVYNFFPIKRLGVGVNFGYSHYFLRPNNDINQLLIGADAKYYFFGRNKTSIYLCAAAGSIQIRYGTNTQYTWANFPGDSADGDFSVRNYPYARLGAGLAFNVYNNMTLNFHAAPIFWYGSNKLEQQTYYHLGLYYYFNRKPTLPRKKANEIDWKLF